ncbi:MAG: apolipoprotein N-acyltransferase [Minwuia sp.]|nr:apolipoprotein N-acyltransferase [Minwuia sp.]
MTRLAGRMTALSGWRRLLLAFLLGALMSLGFAPFHLFPVFWIGFGGLLLLLRGVHRGRSAFALGWWFGWGHFIAGLYWIASAFLVEPDKFAWMVPFPVLGLPALLALFPAIAVWLAWRLSGPGTWRLFLLAAGWTLAEVARGEILTGFPWNLAGYGFGFADAAMQPAAWIGTVGLSFVAVLAGGAPALALVGRNHWRAPVAILLGTLVLVGAGAWRLSNADRTPSDPHAPTIRIVQANIAQRDKWRPDLIEANFARNLSMSLPSVTDPMPDLVIWPETAATFRINADLAARQRIAQVATQINGLVITGAPRTEGTAGATRFFNSAVAINADARIIDSADKRHLVPFGEYLPLRGLLSRIGLDKLAQGRGDFSSGEDGTGGLLHLPGLPPARVLICYEVIFADEVGSGESRPGWLLSLTNDAWFGTLTGPDQHFAMARFRAVEQGLPLVRAAGTGISAIVDAYGQVQGRLDLGVKGTLTGALPGHVEKSLYAVTGRWPMIAIICMLLVVPLITMIMGKRRQM